MSAMMPAARNPLLESPSLMICAAPTEAKLRALLQHWQSWPKRNDLPGRDQFEPADMPHLLPHLCLLEFDRHANPYRDYDALFRYIGTRIGEDFNMSNSTRTHMSDFGATFSQRWFPVYDRVIESRRPLVVQGVPYLIDKTYLRFELLFLPLTRGDATVKDATCDQTAQVEFTLFGGVFGPNLGNPAIETDWAPDSTATPYGGDTSD
ncbi:MAG TPA: PAS domain-containing protein [Dongiaceae bacterium]|nr:PAS domain-containing protein [Dongiaceae bacterium]